MLPPKVSDCQKNCSELYHSVMNLDRGNKFDLWYYGQVQVTTDLIDCLFRHGQKRMCVKGDITARFFPVTIKIVRVKVAIRLPA